MMVLFGCGAVLLGLAADAIPPTYIWQHPCVCPRGSLGDPPWHCEGGWPPGDYLDTCWCIGSWNTSDNWEDIYGYPGIPDTSTERADLILSNTGCCNDDSQCSVDGDCWSGTCDDAETRLTLKIMTATILGLHIVTDSTSATTDALTVNLDRSTPSASNTLTAGYVFIDATNGPVTLSLGVSATLQTN
jgi:hypothetical protein